MRPIRVQDTEDSEALLNKMFESYGEDAPESLSLQKEKLEEIKEQERILKEMIKSGDYSEEEIKAYEAELLKLRREHAKLELANAEQAHRDDHKAVEVGRSIADNRVLMRDIANDNIARQTACRNGEKTCGAAIGGQ